MKRIIHALKITTNPTWLVLPLPHWLLSFTRRYFSGRRPPTRRIILLCLVAAFFAVPAIAQTEGGVTDAPVVTVIGTANGGGTPMTINAAVNNTLQSNSYEAYHKIKNI